MTDKLKQTDIFNPKPQGKVSKTNALFESSEVTYSSGTVTYSSPLFTYGGSDAIQDTGPQLFSVKTNKSQVQSALEYQRPQLFQIDQQRVHLRNTGLITILDPGSVSPQSGMPMGLLLALTYSS